MTTQEIEHLDTERAERVEAELVARAHVCGPALAAAAEGHDRAASWVGESFA